MPLRKYDKKYPYDITKIYSRAKALAKYNRQEWAFTIDTWWDMWQDGDLWQHRGREPHQYCMVRLDPIEAWGPHNCIIVARRQFMKKSGYENFIPGFPRAHWQRKHDVRNKKND